MSRGFLAGVLLATGIWWAVVGVVATVLPLLFLAVAALGSSAVVLTWPAKEEAAALAPDVPPRCDRCRFWDPDPTGNSGDCRAGQPWLFEGSDTNRGRWAWTSAADWCGEFDEKDGANG